MEVLRSLWDFLSGGVSGIFSTVWGGLTGGLGGALYGIMGAAIAFFGIPMLEGPLRGLADNIGREGDEPNWLDNILNSVTAYRAEHDTDFWGMAMDFAKWGGVAGATHGAVTQNIVAGAGDTTAFHVGQAATGAAIAGVVGLAVTGNLDELGVDLGNIFGGEDEAPAGLPPVTPPVAVLDPNRPIGPI